jgi:nitrite reductase/ring-hydroxylating ferredoxin subunit
MRVDDSFTAAAAAGDLPEGQMLKVTVGQEGILLFNVGGNLYATEEMCTHGDASLADGLLCDGEIECPLHGACFSVKTGAVLMEPAVEPLRTFPVVVSEGRIFIRVVGS